MYGFLSPSLVIFLSPKGLLSVLAFCFESLYSPGSQGTQLALCQRWVQVTARTL